MSEDSNKSADQLKEYYNRRVRLKVQQFTGMPVFLFQLLHDLPDNGTNIQTLSQHVRIDPGITTNLLRLANSSRYGPPKEVATLEQAIERLGLDRTLEMLQAFHVAGHLTKPLKGYHLETNDFLLHLIWTATAAENIAYKLQVEGTDIIFTATLLHDMGKLLLSNFVFEERDAILALIQNTHCPFEQAEKDVLSWNHAEVGAAIMERWNFPEILVQAVQYHHNPDDAPETYRQIDLIIHVAECFAYMRKLEHGLDNPYLHQKLEQLGLDLETANTIVEETERAVEALKTSFDI